MSTTTINPQRTDAPTATIAFNPAYGSAERFYALLCPQTSDGYGHTVTAELRNGEKVYAECRWLSTDPNTGELLLHVWKLDQTGARITAPDGSAVIESLSVYTDIARVIVL